MWNGYARVMERFLSKLLRGGLVGMPLVAACSCPPQKILRAPSALAGTTIPAKLTSADCERLCGPGITTCERVAMSADPLQPHQTPANLEFAVMCSVPPACVGGRRPAGLATSSIADAGLGAHFAGLARLEAASVHAFVELAVELELHGAPRALIDAAHRAAIEEIEHARATTQLARRFGVDPAPPEVVPTPPRDLAAILVENATEGLVYERYGAALAADRAVHAGDPAVRAAMHTIARDEAGHADLAAAVHTWGIARVPRAARRRVDEARDASVDELRALLDVEPAPALAMLGGMPSATRATDLLALVA